MGEKTKVLVVDDDRRMVRTICDILKVKGCEAAAAYTGEMAVEHVRSARPDCVLMDIKMPGINGVETLQLLRQIAPHLPVVLMSAYATDELAFQARRQGADAVLAKPLDISSILSFLALLRKEESVLIVDDDPNFCGTLKDILQSRGYKVETEDDPGKVLGHMEQDYKLVVLLDLKLGQSDGLDVLTAIRTKYPTKPVLLMAGYKEGLGSVIEQGLKIGAATCLYKPLAIDELLESIDAISRAKRRAILDQSA